MADDGEDSRRLAQLVREGRKLEAIKLVRTITGCGLAEGKDAVEKLERDLAQSIQAPALNSTDAEAEVRRLVRSGDKIQAIKLYREATHCGLKEAKDAVDRIEAER